MADYVSILAKAIGGLADNTADNRQLIYQKARGAIDRKLRAMDPVPSEAAIGEQMAQLEAAIDQVEGEHQLAAVAEPVEPAQEAPAEPVQEPRPAPVSEPVAVEPQPAEAAPQIPAANPPAGFIDDVILIDGIGEKTRTLLEGEGITGISQIAAMNDESLAAIAEKIGFPDFEKNQQWKEQASDMLSGKLPRSKTDQDRLKKLAEEAGVGVQSEPSETAPPEPAMPVADRPADLPTPPKAEAVPTGPVEETGSASDPVVTEPPLTEPPVAETSAPETSAPETSAPETPAAIADSPEPTKDEKAIADAIRALSKEKQAADNDVAQTAAPATPAEPAVAAPVPPVQDPFLGAQPAEASIAPPVAEPQISATPSVDASPPYVSELEGDPLAAPQADPYTPPGSVDLGRKKGGAGKTIGCLAILALLGGAGYAAWANQDVVKPYFDKAVTAVQELIGGSDDNQGETAPASGSEEQSAEEGDQDTGSDSDSTKDNSRLGGDGTTEDAPAETGQGNGDENAGDGTSGSDQSDAATDGSTDNADDSGNGDETAPRSIISDPIENADQNATVEVEGEQGNETPASGETAEPDNSDNQTAIESVSPAVVNGEKAFLYEEALGATGASRDEGGILWSLANEAPEAGAPPEAVIKGVMEIPARGVTMNLSIKRNVDPGLPASHLIELFFTAQSQFSGGNIDNVSRFVMKATEQARGESLVGVPARIDTGFFLIALNNLDQARQTNLGLLANAEWIDIPVAYVTGRRGLMTFEKGESGRKVFADAIADWRNR